MTGDPSTKSTSKWMDTFQAKNCSLLVLDAEQCLIYYCTLKVATCRCVKVTTYNIHSQPNVAIDCIGTKQESNRKRKGKHSKGTKEI